MITGAIQWALHAFRFSRSADKGSQIKQSKVSISRHCGLWPKRETNCTTNFLVPVLRLVDFFACEARYQSDCVRIDQIARFIETEVKYGIPAVVAHSGQADQRIAFLRHCSAKLLAKNLARFDK